MAKLKLAGYWASACGGCDVAILDLDQRFLEIAEAAEIVFWPIATDGKYDDLHAMEDGWIDVCLFSGGVRSSENEALARLLRAKSKILVALGSCAHLGGIPGLANLAHRRELLRTVYRTTRSTVNPEGAVPTPRVETPCGELELPSLLEKVLPLEMVVPVDLTIPGCPPSTERLWEVVRGVLAGSIPARGAVVGATDKALCDECTRTRNEKRLTGFRSLATFTPDPEACLLEQGVICCGPATRGGCGAACIASNMPCRGCYGPTPGVVDHGGKLLSAIASVIDSSDPQEIERIVGQIEDPVGTLYRFGLAAALLPGVRCWEVA
jgi:F420-non-reducing hydrogenase small subunit